MTAVVLVHGLYHRPEHFALVAEPLRTAGTEVVVPELHRGSLTADTAAVQKVVDSLPQSAIVLGHSYGGSVITGLRGVGHLVYLAAFVPDAGESAAGLGGASARLRAAIEPGSDGSTGLHPDRAADTLYGDCPEPLADWAVGLLRTQAPGCGRGVPERHSWRDNPLHLCRLRAGPGHRPGSAAGDGVALYRRARMADGPLPVRGTARSRGRTASGTARRRHRVGEVRAARPPRGRRRGGGSTAVAYRAADSGLIARQKSIVRARAGGPLPAPRA